MTRSAGVDPAVEACVCACKGDNDEVNPGVDIDADGDNETIPIPAPAPAPRTRGAGAGAWTGARTGPGAEPDAGAEILPFFLRTPHFLTLPILLRRVAPALIGLGLGLGPELGLGLALRFALVMVPVVIDAGVTGHAREVEAWVVAFNSAYSSSLSNPCSS
jgi:hypothetical protein